MLETAKYEDACSSMLVSTAIYDDDDDRNLTSNFFKELLILLLPLLLFIAPLFWQHIYLPRVVIIDHLAHKLLLEFFAALHIYYTIITVLHIDIASTLSQAYFCQDYNEF